MMKKTLALLIVLAVFAAPLYAAEPSAWKAKGGSYGEIVGHKFIYGLSNVALGWSEILTEPYEAIRDGENPLMGFGKGIWNAVGDTVGGVLHLVTFPCPKTDIPLPEGGIVLPCCKK